MKNFIEEFKAFAMKGNVVDLAVAVVIGATFGKIVTSLVTNIITPLIGVLLGGIDFTGLKITVGGAAITYGIFIQSVVDFVIVAFVIFVVVKILSRIKKKEAIALVTPVEPSAEVKLLIEIRDSLRRS